MKKLTTTCSELNINDKQERYLKMSIKTKTHNKILSSYDYESFSFLEENRKISNGLIKKLKYAIQEKDLEIPIIVNSKLKIIDGQHRFEVRRDLKLPIIFYIDDKITSKDIGTINNVTEKWSLEQWLHHHIIRAENKDYPVLDWFVEEYNINISSSLVLIYNRSSEGIQIFKDGNLKIKNLEEMKKKAEILTKFYEDYGFDKYKHKTFIEAINTLWINKKINFNKLFRQLDKSKKPFKQLATKNQYIEEFEEIMNLGVSENKKINIPSYVPNDVIQNAMDKGERIDLSKVLY